MSAFNPSLSSRTFSNLLSMKNFFRFPLLLLLLLLTSHLLSAQNPSKTTIKGLVSDTLGTELGFATVMLLNPKDSTLANFTRSDEHGAFAFKNVRNVPYILKISYIGYLPYQQHLPVSDAEAVDLQAIRIKPISTELMEVVIRTAKAPLRIHGDTIEYDATTFKVPPGSTVEDLLRRLPGLELDADGNIRAQGKDVKRVYVDGKTFFGDDPKSATKNLGAETISKVQVYDEKSEQTKLTGVDDGKKEKAMNLELKDEFKKGSFGKLTGAVGSSDRWAARGNYNRFNQKQQLSFIGYGNNINQTGVNWEDYGEFKGQSTFSGYDNGDFGFSGNGNQYFNFGGEDGLNNFDGRGFTKNFGGGSNYNFDNKKAKFNLSYFYNETALQLDQFGFRQNFLPEGSFINTDTTNRLEFRGSHSIGTRFEKDLDSNNVLIVKANGRFSKNTTDYQQSQLFLDVTDQPTNRLAIDNDTRLNSWRVTSAAIFRHRFKKKGRSIAFSGGFNSNQSDGTENLFSINRFFEAQTFRDQIRLLNDNYNKTNQWKGSALFTEPLAKKWFWETFYNFSNSQNEVNQQAQNREIGDMRIDSLSVFYDQNTLYQRIGSSVRYSFQGLNTSVGLAAQQIRLDGEYSRDQDEPLLTDPVSRTFYNLTPNVSFNYEFKNNTSVNFDYSYNINAPQLNDLQPVPNVNNPLFRIEGNPDLRPERINQFNINYNYWNPANFANLGVGSGYSQYDDQIVYNQTIEVIDTVGIRTTTRPDNVSGGNNFEMYSWFNLPIIKTKLTLNGGVNANIGQTPAFVNGVENETNNNGYGGRLGFNFTPNQKLILGISSRLQFNDLKYSIQQEQNQRIQNHSVDASVKWQFAGKFFLESNFNYAIYRNNRFGFNRDVPIWNGSIRRLIGKNNRLEMRLAAFDLLNRRVSIIQNGSQNYVTRNIANTLARYYMLSVSYNVRGYENKLKKNNWE